MQEKDNNNPGMYLLRKSHRGILRLIFSNFAFAAGAFASQLFILV